jgi:hypothetical protein
MDDAVAGPPSPNVVPPPANVVIICARKTNGARNKNKSNSFFIIAVIEYKINPISTKTQPLHTIESINNPTCVLENSKQRPKTLPKKRSYS